MNRVPKALTSWLSSAADSFTQEAKLRAEDGSLSRFDRRKYVLIVFVFVALSIVTIFQLVTPPEDIAETIKRNSDLYYGFSEGRVFFAQDRSASPSNTKFNIKLPFRAMQTLNGYDPKNIWYEFHIEIPSTAHSLGRLGLLIPKTWGKSEIYFDDQLKDFGENLRTVIPITRDSFNVFIHAEVGKDQLPTPILATYPLTVGNIDELRALSKNVDVQLETYIRANAVYGLAVMLFGMLFVAYPKKPELLAFIFFLMFTMGSILAETARVFGDKVFEKYAPYLQTVITLDLFGNAALLLFSLLFFRIHPSKAIRQTLFSLAINAILGAAIFAFLMKALPTPGPRSVARLTIGGIFFFLQIYYLFPVAAIMVRSESVPKIRKLTAALVFSTIVAFYLMNISDYFVDFFAVTTLPRNNLVLHIMLAVIVSFEVARAEVRQLILGSMLPSEVRESVHSERDKLDERGYVLLVDALGFSSSRERFSNLDIRSSYLESLAHQMLKPIEQISMSNFSILNCTGDGIYCAIRGEPNQENFDRAIALAESIAWAPALGSTNDPINFRVALGFGEYGIRIIKVGKIRKNFVAGNILNDLSRIIGSGSSTVRVLVSPETEGFLDSNGAESVTDKHGFIHRFVTKTKKERAA